MQVLRALSPFVLLVFAVSCAHVPAKAPDKSTLIGAWYGNSLGADSGESGDNLVVRNADGTFVSYFRLCDERGEISTIMVETGRWDYADGVETTHTLTINGQAVEAGSDYYRESYRLEPLAPDKLKLVSLKAYANGYPEFVSTRIGISSFHLPVEPCSNTARP
jgi:hypothetical protein